MKSNGLIKGLPPLCGDKPKVLILGSMPSTKSLEAGMYYSHKQNRFFKIMFKYFDLPYSENITDRQALIKNNHLALFDVIGECRRENSSLDSKIKDEKPSDIDAILKAYPSIKTIILNGGKAKTAFEKYNKDILKSNINVIPLPSTSPANASMSFEKLYSLYKSALDGNN